MYRCIDCMIRADTKHYNRLPPYAVALLVEELIELVCFDCLIYSFRLMIPASDKIDVFIHGRTFVQHFQLLCLLEKEAAERALRANARVRLLIFVRRRRELGQNVRWIISPTRLGL